MSANKLTNTEAERLITMIKHSLVTDIQFPARSKEEEFHVLGETKKDLFTIGIYRGKINPLKYNIHARIKLNNILLMELHIGKNLVHPNPNGEKIKGNHWHIYTEEYGRRFAFPAENIEDDAFVENTIAFMTKFNIIEQPKITYQLELL